MPPSLSLLDLALAIRDHIVAGTFDPKIFNSFLQPHAEIILQQQSSPSTQTFGPSDHVSQSDVAESNNTSRRSNSNPIQNLNPPSLVNYHTSQVPGSSIRPYDLTYVEPPCSISGPQSSAKKKRRLSPSNDADIVETGGFRNSWNPEFAMGKSPQSCVYDHPGRVEFQRNTPISNPNPENIVVPSSVEASQRPLKIIHSSYEALGQPPLNPPRTRSGSINKHGLPDNADQSENEKSREPLPAPSMAHPPPIESTVPNTRSMYDYRPNSSLIHYKHD